jgi:hypothetical protein
VGSVVSGEEPRVRFVSFDKLRMTKLQMEEDDEWVR